MSTFPRVPSSKEVVRRFVEGVINRERLDLVNRLVAEDYVFHCADGDLYGWQGALLNIAEMRSAFPDLHMDIADLIEEDDLVARRFVLRGFHLGPFLGIEPSGCDVAIPGIGLDRVVNGQIAESWVSFNMHGPTLIRTSLTH